MVEPLCAELAVHLRAQLAADVVAESGGQAALGGVSAAWLESVRSKVLSDEPGWPAALLAVCAEQAQERLRSIWAAMGARVLAQARAASELELQAEAAAQAQAAKDDIDRVAMAAGEERREARRAHSEAGAAAGSESDAARLRAEERAFAANQAAELERLLQARCYLLPCHHQRPPCPPPPPLSSPHPPRPPLYHLRPPPPPTSSSTTLTSLPPIPITAEEAGQAAEADGR